jgi:hypothetical protein
MEDVQDIVRRIFIPPEKFPAFRRCRPTVGFLLSVTVARFL